MVRFRSSPISAPDAIKLRLFLNAHHKGSLPMQLKVVWNQLLQADPEGPTLINCTARPRLIRFCDLLIRVLLQHTYFPVGLWEVTIQPTF